jgi:tetratricopeptide (TPR) repeat protein
LRVAPADLPADVNTMLIARIDRLSHQVKQIVQTAAVLGREFDAQLLSKMLQMDVLPEVQQAEHEQIWSALRELRYIFKHALLRDAAYEMQLHSRLRDLHSLTAVTVEQVYAEQLPVYYDMLAYHYQMAYQLGAEAAVERARYYLHRAGEAAQENFANAAALEYYGQLLPLLTDAKEQTEILMKRGAVFELIGQWNEAEQDYRAALDTAGAAAQFALGKLCRLRGDYGQALAWLEQARAGWTAQHNQSGLSRVLIEIGAVFEHKTEYAAARRYLEEGLTLAQASGDRLGAALALYSLGTTAYNQGDYAAAQRLFAESLALRRELGNKQGIAISLNGLGCVAADLGDYVTAREIREEALAIQREIDDKGNMAITLNNLGLVAVREGGYATARALYEESLALEREVGAKLNVASTLSCLGNMTWSQGDYAGARAFLEESLALCRQIGNIQFTAYALLGLGLVALSAPRHSTEAREHILSSTRQWQKLGGKVEQTSCLIEFAGLALHEGDACRAARLLGSAAAALVAIKLPLEPEIRLFHTQTLAKTRAQLDEESFSAAWAEGEKITLAEAVDLVLQEWGNG